MPNINLSILNQKATPAFFADTLANRPAPSFVGRIFISTDTLDLYRDTGTAWLLLSPSSTGTITGSGAAGQVTYFSGTSSITGSNDLFWDNVNGHFGIGTNVPGTALDVHHDQPTIAILNQTVATNDTRIGFQNNGTALWRIGNFYNAGANDWGIFDVVGAAQPFTIKKTTGQTFIGAETSSSGRLVVNNTTGDNHIVVIGATAPSIRVRNAGVSPTRQFGLGLATTTNNFIQGTTGGEFCIFNASTTASPILFGVYDAGTGNTQEAARISAARNFLIGTTTDGGQKLQVNGKGYINDTLILDGTNTGQYLNFYNSGVDRAHIYWQESLNNLSIGTYVAGGSIQFEVDNNVDAMFLNSSGNLGLGVTPSAWSLLTALQISGGASLAGYGGATYLGQNFYYGSGGDTYISNGYSTRYTQFNGQHQWFTAPSGTAGNAITFTQPMTLAVNGNLLIGTTTDNGYKLQAAGVIQSTNTSGYLLRDGDVAGYGIFKGSSTRIGIAANGNEVLSVFSSGNVLIGTTTDAGQKLQVAGETAITNSGGIQLNLVYSGSTKTTFRCDSAGGLLIDASTGSYIYTYIGGVQRLGIKPNTINIASIPTSAAGLVSGDIYSNAGILTIVP